MEVLTEEESRLVMESMIPPFTRHDVDELDATRLFESGQDVLLIHGPGQEYKFTTNYDMPSLHSDHEILVKVRERHEIEAKLSDSAIGHCYWLEPHRLERTVGCLHGVFSGRPLMFES